MIKKIAKNMFFSLKVMNNWYLYDAFCRVEIINVWHYFCKCIFCQVFKNLNEKLGKYMNKC